MKKVLIITATIDSGGAERIIVDTAKELLKRGNYYPSICSFVGNGDLRKEIEEAGVEYHHLSFKAITHFLNNIRKMRQFIKKAAPDIIHTHQLAADFYGSISAVGLKIPIVSHVHNPDMPQPVFKKIAKFFVYLFFVNAFIVSIEEKLASLKLFPKSKKKVFILHNAIDQERLIASQNINKKSLKESFGIPKNSFVIGSVGRLSWEKGYDLLLKAFNKTLEKHSNSFLVIVGSGPTRAELNTLIKTLNIPKKVLLVGYSKNIASFLSIFDIFVASSRMESFSLASLEAMALGVPTIITDRFSSKQLFSRAAMVVPCSSEGITKGIINLIEDPKLQHDMSAQAKNFVNENFLIDGYAKKLISIYDNVLGKT